MEGLDKNAGSVEMATTDATDDLGEEFKSALFGRIIGEGKTSIGLDDADGSEMGKIEAFGDGLGANNNIDIARFDFVIKRVEAGGFGVVSIKTGNFSGFEELFELGFEKFGTKTFVKEVG